MVNSCASSPPSSEARRLPFNPSPHRVPARRSTLSIAAARSARHPDRARRHQQPGGPAGGSASRPLHSPHSHHRLRESRTSSSMRDIRQSRCAELARPAAPALIGGDKPGSTNLTFARWRRRAQSQYPGEGRLAGAADMFRAMARGDLDGEVIGLAEWQQRGEDRRTRGGVEAVELADPERADRPIRSLPTPPARTNESGRLPLHTMTPKLLRAVGLLMLVLAATGAGWFARGYWLAGSTDASTQVVGSSPQE